MPGNSCIFRLTNSGQTESTVTDKIEFDIGVVPDNTSHIRESQFRFTSGIAEKPRFGKQTLTEDTGPEKLDVIITGHIEKPRVTQMPNRLLQWWREPKTNAFFRRGRFGLRLDDYPWFDVTPTSTIGYILYDVQLIRDGEYPGRSAFVAMLRLVWDE